VKNIERKKVERMLDEYHKRDRVRVGDDEEQDRSWGIRDIRKTMKMKSRRICLMAII
jgi:hypothetical protein